MNLENINLDTLSWILVLLSLLGNYYVIQKKVKGQWLWAIANVGWISYDLYIQNYSQAFLFAVYLGLCIWAIQKWTREDREAARKV